MLRKYMLDGLTYQFEDGKAPARAIPLAENVEVADAEPKKKEARPANKARKAVTK